MNWFSIEAEVAASASLISLISLIVALAAIKRTKNFSPEFSPQGVAHRLLTQRKWRYRTFRDLKHHLGGFADDELRKILVRAGGIRLTAGGEEAWGLLSRNRKLLSLEDVKKAPAPEKAAACSAQQQEEEQELKTHGDSDPPRDSSEPFERLRAEMIKLGGLECVRSAAKAE